MSKKLTSCKDCNKEVSKKAKVCPECGVSWPAYKNSAVSAILLLAVIFGIPTCMVMNGDDDKPIKQQATKQQATQAKKVVDPCPIPTTLGVDQLVCFANKHKSMAGILCAESLERMAKYDVKWTNSWMESKLNGAIWNLGDAKGLDYEILSLEYWSDKATIQNAYGAYQKVTLHCDYDFRNEQVLDIRVE